MFPVIAVAGPTFEEQSLRFVIGAGAALDAAGKITRSLGLISTMWSQNWTRNRPFQTKRVRLLAHAGG
jgi:hypothetical protein